MSKTMWLSLPLVLSAACAEDRQQEPRLSPAAGRAVEPNWNDRVSVSQLADAYCDTEERCQKIGPDRVYARRDVCETEWDRRGVERLNMMPCRGGMDERRVSACLASIRAQACDETAGQMTAVQGCEPVDLCRSR